MFRSIDLSVARLAFSFICCSPLLHCPLQFSPTPSVSLANQKMAEDGYVLGGIGGMDGSNDAATEFDALMSDDPSWVRRRKQQQNVFCSHLHLDRTTPLANNITHPILPFFFFLSALFICDWQNKTASPSAATRDLAPAGDASTSVPASSSSSLASPQSSGSNSNLRSKTPRKSMGGAGAANGAGGSTSKARVPAATPRRGAAAAAAEARGANGSASTAAASTPSASNRSKTPRRGGGGAIIPAATASSSSSGESKETPTSLAAQVASYSASSSSSSSSSSSAYSMPESKQRKDIPAQCTPGHDPYVVVATGVELGPECIFTLVDNRIQFNTDYLEQVNRDDKTTLFAIQGAENFGFDLDAIYGNEVPHVFEECVKPIVDVCVKKGENGTVLGYGQTHQNKRLMMYGNMQDPREYGLIPAAVTYAFELCKFIESLNPNVKYVWL